MGLLVLDVSGRRLSLGTGRQARSKNNEQQEPSTSSFVSFPARDVECVDGERRCAVGVGRVRIFGRNRWFSGDDSRRGAIGSVSGCDGCSDVCVFGLFTAQPGVGGAVLAVVVVVIIFDDTVNRY